MNKKQTVFVGVAGVLILGLYTVNILFTDGMRFSKGTYEYWLTISSDTIQAFPLFGLVEDPVYFYSSGDGPSPSVQEIVYLSSSSEGELAQEINSFLADRGYSKQGNFFVKGNDQISVTLVTKANNLVEVSALLARD